MPTITRVEVVDVRFPTSLHADGSDAAEAADLAASADVAVVVVGYTRADEGEFMADPEEIITFKRVMLHADQVPLNKRTVFSHAQLKAKNHRGRRWPHNFKAELQTLTLVERLDVMRAAIEAELDHAQLEEDRAVVEGEREEIRGELERLRDGE